jgi:hypothetical protein
MRWRGYIHDDENKKIKINEKMRVLRLANKHLFDKRSTEGHD